MARRFYPPTDSDIYHGMSDGFDPCPECVETDR